MSATLLLSSPMVVSVCRWPPLIANHQPVRPLMKATVAASGRAPSEHSYAPAVIAIGTAWLLTWDTVEIDRLEAHNPAPRLMTSKRRRVYWSASACEIKWHRHSCGIADNVHQHRQTKLAAAQSDKTGQATNRNAPCKCRDHGEMGQGH